MPVGKNMLLVILATNSTVTQSNTQSSMFDVSSLLFIIPLVISAIALVVSYYSYKEAKRLSDVTAEGLNKENERFLLKGRKGTVPNLPLHLRNG